MVVRIILQLEMIKIQTDLTNRFLVKYYYTLTQKVSQTFVLKQFFDTIVSARS